MVLAELSDRELLARHVDGDEHAFGEIVRRHRDRLWAVALRTLGDPEEAADAVQDALVSAFRGAAGFRGDAAVTTWLHRVVVNACLDRMRRKAVRPTVQLPDDEAAPVDPRDPVVEREIRIELRRALDTLSPDQRAVLILVDMEGYPVEEAARILGVPPGTVKSRCARARAKLLPMLEHLRSRPASPPHDPPKAPPPRSEAPPGYGNRSRPPSVSTPKGRSAGLGRSSAGPGNAHPAYGDGGETE